ncbi:MAG: hypothetical protein AAF639_24530, partial [Chloroflexota bacterium]
MKRFLFSLILAFALLPVCRSQESIFDMSRPYKVVGLNATPLLVQLIPFNRANPEVTGPYYMNFR